MHKYFTIFIAVLSLLLAAVTFGQVTSSTGETIGVPMTGEPGITVPVSQLMKAEQTRVKLPFAVRPKKEDFEVDRHSLPQNPASPAVGIWPAVKQAKSVEQLFGVMSPQAVGTTFLGIQVSETPGYTPPDIMGDVGPTQILVHVNGRIKVFDKSGTVGGLNVDDNTFWTSVRNGADVTDPHVRYDPISGRWFVVMLNMPASGANRIMIAVSSGSTISSTSSFTFFQFTGRASAFADYPTLGIDANAVYIGANIFNIAGTSFLGSDGYVIKKSSLLTGTLTVTKFAQLNDGTNGGPYTPQGVQNDDPTATEGYFIGVDNANYGQLDVRRVSTPGGTPTISGDLTITVPTTAAPIAQVAKGSTSTLDAIDDRLFAAMMKKNTLTGVVSLWTAHSIEVNTSGAGASGGGRNGSRWYEIRNLTTTPTLAQSGTVYSSAASNPIGYWFPSVAMSGQGHMALGCSYASTNDYTSIAVTGRFSSDATGTTQGLTSALVGTAAYNFESTGPQRWGDYSQTVVDPTDNMTMWTFQEYANSTDSWALRAIQLKAPLPATPSSVSPASVNTNATNVSLVLTGTSSSGSGFYDPGASYPNRISASVSGSGVTVNSVTFTSATSITLNVSVAAGATAGTRTITVTNPDGQSATSATGILTINNVSCPTFTLSPSTLPNGAAGVAYNQTITTTGGTGPYTYSVTTGTLPAGLTLSSGGVLSGTSVYGTSATFTVTATDANTCTGTQAYTLTITGCPQITLAPTTLPNGSIGAAYSQTITATGGAGSYTYSITSGSVPAGLTLSSAGVLSGIPTTATTFSFTVTATDGNTCTGSQAYSVTVNSCPAITLSPTTLANGTVSAAYSQTLTATGGTASYTYAVASGTLPDGVTLSTAGVLSGTPTTAATATFTVTATDANTCTGSQAYSLTVNAGGSSGSTSLTATGVAYTQDFNTLASTGTSSTLPSGWFLYETGTAANTTYTAGTGSGTAGDTYSFGPASGSNRAFGTLLSGSCIPTIGASFTNNTGATITSLTISYTGEQWRVGATRTAPDSLLFSLSTTATSLSTGTWVRYGSLDLTSPTLNTTVGAVDGTQTANQKAVSATITGLSIANGATFFVRWADYNISSSDDGLAVDNFSLTPTTSGGSPTNPTVAGAASPNSVAAGAATLITASVTPGSNPSSTGLAVTADLSNIGGSATQTMYDDGTNGDVTASNNVFSYSATVSAGTSTGSKLIRFTVTDAQARTAKDSITITVTPASCPTITLAPSTLPAGSVGIAYSQSVTASGGTSPYTYAVTSGALPAGLGLSTAGLLSGTPTGPGQSTFTVTATDANTCTGNQAYTVTITGCATITLSPSTLPDGTVGASYNQTITASGGTAAYTYAVTSGTLPAGLSLSTAGALTGTPTASGAASFTVTATDANTCTGNQAYSFTINTGVSSASISLTVSGAAYSQNFDSLASTGTTSSVVPAGWLFIEAGTNANTTYSIGNGNTNTGETWSYGAASSTDRAFGGLASNALQTTIGASFTNHTGGPITSLNIAFTGEEWRCGVSRTTTDSLLFSYSTDATSLTTGTWTSYDALSFFSPVISGTVGALDGNAAANRTAISGVITGLSIANGATFMIRWADKNILGTDDGLAVDDFSLTPVVTVPATNPSVVAAVTPASIIAGTTTLLTGTVAAGTNPTSTGITVTADLSAVGGSATQPMYDDATHGDATASDNIYSYSVTVSGTIGSKVLRISVNDAQARSGRDSATLTVTCPAITLSPSTLPASTAGVAYDQTITADGGKSPYTYTVSGGVLPSGITLATGGVLTGKASASSPATFTVTATDSNGCTGSHEYTLQINCPEITLGPSSLPNDTVGRTYNQTITASGGIAPYRFTLASGAVPTGLSLAKSGALSGTTTAVGSFTFTILATDSFGCTGSKAFTLAIADTPVISNISVLVSVDSLWNIVSNPFEEGDNALSALFPNTISPSAFSFNGAGYNQTSILQYGSGYWLKFSNAHVVTLNGHPHTIDTLAVTAGWNMIGTLTDSIPVSAVTPLSTVQLSQFFGYYKGYFTAETLKPGKGYWAKFSNDGFIILAKPVVSKAAPGPIGENGSGGK